MTSLTEAVEGCEPAIHGVSAQSTLQAENVVGHAVDPNMLAMLSGANCVLPGKITKDRAVCELVAGRFVAASCSPISRWKHSVERHDTFNPAQTYGAFALPRLGFDSSAFGISALESRSMDPQMALTLEICSGALRADADAQLHSQIPSESADVGVFLGIGGSTTPSSEHQSQDWGRSPQQKPSVYAGTSNTLSVASGRLSYTLGLTGPCLSVDTACSSSLVAAHLGFAALELRECQAALAAGVGLLDESITAAFSTAGMLSCLGRCHTFDHLADGYCRAEGCGAFVYRPHEAYGH